MRKKADLWEAGGKGRESDAFLIFFPALKSSDGAGQWAEGKKAESSVKVGGEGSKCRDGGENGVPSQVFPLLRRCDWALGRVETSFCI